jgi:ABC-type Mn2+/Zn2+ transport system permease subunit
MIQDFVRSWPLFHDGYLAGWLIGLLLSLPGVLVIARDQIFVGAAISQASLLGIAIGMHAGSLPLAIAASLGDSDAFLSACAGAMAVAAAVLTTRAGRTGGSHESVTGWVFLVGASLSVLLLSQSPHGTEEIHRLLASTIIGATSGDVALLAVLVAATAAGVWRWRSQLVLLAIDPEMAAAVGLRVGRWATATAVCLGVAVGLSNRVAGMIYAFGCLVLPALVARSLCREVRSMFVVAPVVALAAGVVGFVLANHYDTPPGQTAVALLCALALAAWPVRALRLRLGARE